MAIKTISLEMDAYEKLRRAKRGPRESFSSVVRRAWDDLPPSARKLLDDLRSLSAQHPEVLLPPDRLNALEKRERTARRTSRWRRYSGKLLDTSFLIDLQRELAGGPAGATRFLAKGRTRAAFFSHAFR